jgi:hypothetical protein
MATVYAVSLRKPEPFQDGSQDYYPEVGLCESISETPGSRATGKVRIADIRKLSHGGTNRNDECGHFDGWLVTIGGGAESTGRSFPGAIITATYASLSGHAARPL